MVIRTFSSPATVPNELMGRPLFRTKTASCGGITATFICHIKAKELGLC